MGGDHGHTMIYALPHRISAFLTWTVKRFYTSLEYFIFVSQKWYSGVDFCLPNWRWSPPTPPAFVTVWFEPGWTWLKPGFQPIFNKNLNLVHRSTRITVKNWTWFKSQPRWSSKTGIGSSPVVIATTKLKSQFTGSFIPPKPDISKINRFVNHL